MLICLVPPKTQLIFFARQLCVPSISIWDLFQVPHQVGRHRLSHLVMALFMAWKYGSFTLEGHPDPRRPESPESHWNPIGSIHLKGVEP